MNKRLLYILIAGICISLLGIIAVQFFWIRNAFQVKEAQFDRSVNDALGSAVNKLETKENMHFISRNFEGDSIMSILQAFTRDSSNNLKTRLDSLLANSEAGPPMRRRPPPAHSKPSGVMHYSYQINLVPGQEISDSVVVMMDPGFREDVALTFEWNDQVEQLDSIIQENERRFYKELRDGSLENMSMVEQHQIITLSPEAHGNATIQYHFSSPEDVVHVNPGNYRRQQNRKAIDSSIKRLDNKAKKIQDVIKQMAMELETRPAPLQQRINKKSLQSTLQEAFANKGINLPFEFAVMTPSNDSNPVPIQSAGYEKEFSKSAHKVSLFPNDIFGKSDLLLVHFPGQKSEILKSVSLLLIGSILFTLIIILTSGASIVVMIRQKKISDIKTDFINNMTHEFKTPIATISIAADSINNQKVIAEPEKIRNFTRIIKEENNRMNARVEQVLQMALLDSRDFRLRLRLVDMHFMIEKAVEHYRLQIEQREGSIITRLEASDTMVDADEDHIRNVLMNLLDNANKYSIIKPEITVFSYNRGGKFYFGVADRGMGMSQEAQRKAFDKFFRVTSGNIHKIKGFGLGLSYVKAIVLAHHGEIMVQSDVGKGSRFEISIPVSPENA
jgi:signal transduction histidine kinase